MFFFKAHAENGVVEILSPDPFRRNQNWPYLRINSIKFYTACFYCMASWGLSKYMETKLQTTCLYLNFLNFISKGKPNVLVSCVYTSNIAKQINCEGKSNTHWLKLANHSTILKIYLVNNYYVSESNKAVDRNR